MESKHATTMLSALGHEGRLAIFRLLVKAGPAGIAAGDIARALDMRPNTLSASLAVLVHAGLIGSRREGRSIRYRVDYAATRGLLVFLMADCCNGAPEICAPLGALLERAGSCASLGAPAAGG
ncbi:ArsR/SmtB family transcription factor [Ancylobacter terrae]|uniref:ArsR/SmtB family transcription factor n=1 Tax=Ancylobacter sp. sgz301288 TaxID=3342077 RepID=UPI00385B336C